MGGKIPVGHVVRAIVSALRAAWSPGTLVTVNISSGGGMSNGTVVRLVQKIVEPRGYRLTTNWNNSAAPGEAKAAVLDPIASELQLGIPRPSQESVTEAIEESVLAGLSTCDQIEEVAYRRRLRQAVAVSAGQQVGRLANLQAVSGRRSGQ